MKSIMQCDKNECYLCGRNKIADPCGLEEHHVFGGANRRMSEKYGLKIYLCGENCHRNGVQSVHKNKIVRKSIQAAGQRAFEQRIGTREEFVRLFGKNYI